MFDPSILPPLPPMAKQPPWVPLGTKDCSQGFCSIYCPQWCYIVFPPPPPFFFDHGDEDDNNSSGSPTFSPLLITIIGILASAFLLISYYVITTKFCGSGGGGGGFFLRRRRHHQNRRDDGLDDNEDAALRRQSRRRDEEWHVPPTVGLDEALIHRITVCKYEGGDGLVGCSDCSVCLGEFREGESLRLLPKCSHAFHVRCIDTWLRSHSNCPLCRANILQLASPAPPQLPAPPPPPPPPPESNADDTGGSVGGTGLENGGESSSKEFEAIEVGGEESQHRQRMRRSFSMDSFRRGRVSVADILRVDMEEDGCTEDEDGEIVVVGSTSRRRQGEHSKGSSSLHCDSPVVAIKRSLSSGRFCLTRQGRGSGRGRTSFLLPI